MSNKTDRGIDVRLPNVEAREKQRLGGSTEIHHRVLALYSQLWKPSHEMFFASERHKHVGLVSVIR